MRRRQRTDRRAARVSPLTRRKQLPQLRAALSSRLSLADDEGFVAMIWALNALQTGRSQVALPFFEAVPEGAATEGILGPHAIYPWELETLGNELLSTPKDPVYRTFNSRNWNAIGDVVNRLRELENAEYGARSGEFSIFDEMGRIGARQFDWQRGFFTLPEIYRSAFVYGQGVCAEYFSRTHGITVADMMLVGYALTVAFQEFPVIKPDRELNVLSGNGPRRGQTGQCLA